MSQLQQVYINQNELANLLKLYPLAQASPHVTISTFLTKNLLL